MNELRFPDGSLRVVESWHHVDVQSDALIKMSESLDNLAGAHAWRRSV